MTNALIVESKLFWWTLVGFASLLGGLFFRREFFKELKPPKTLNIPPFIFGLAWFFLYILEAAAAMVRQFNSDNVGYNWSLSLTLYVVTLFVGVSFMPAFFLFRSFVFGMISLTATWALHLTVLIMFFKEYPISGWLYLPTQIWLTIAVFYFINLWYRNFNRKKIFFT